MLDEDLADLYGVGTKRLVEQVKRNLDRFPEDFMFQLNKEEAAALRSQIATSNTGRDDRGGSSLDDADHARARIAANVCGRRMLISTV